MNECCASRSRLRASAAADGDWRCPECGESFRGMPVELSEFLSAVTDMAVDAVERTSEFDVALLLGSVSTSVARHIDDDVRLLAYLKEMQQQITETLNDRMPPPEAVSP